MNETEREKRKRKLARKRREQVKRQRMILGCVMLAVIFGGILIFVGKACTNDAKEAGAKIEKKEKGKKQKPKKKEESLHMVAVGDNFYHDTVLAEGQSESGQWDFNFLYEHIKKEIQAADLAIVNQEVPLISNPDEATGYPLFGTPLEGGEALANAGFDVVAMATNHSYDKGSTGIQESVSFWKERHPEMTLLGIHDSPESQEKERVKIIEKNGFKIAMLNYTTLINIGAQVPEEESYCVDVYDEEQVKIDVAKAKEEADLVMVYLHTGTEYENEPDQATQERIDFLAEQGVDIALCSHPHVLRPFGMKARPDGEQMLVYYSLGNFVSGQTGMTQLLEGMADITIKRDEKTGKVVISDYSMKPLVMHYESGHTGYAVYPFEDYTEEMAKRHGIHEDSDEEFTMESMQEYFNNYINEMETGR